MLVVDESLSASDYEWVPDARKWFHASTDIEETIRRSVIIACMNALERKDIIEAKRLLRQLFVNE